MIERLQPAVAPAYLLLCLLLGGSAQGYWGNALLRLIAVAIIVWALVQRREVSLPGQIKQLLALISLAVAWPLLQLIPLPMSVWASLPGRASFAEGFKLLGIAPHSMPLSLAPYETIATLLALLPSFGMLAAMIGSRGYSPAWLAATLIGGTIGGVLLGILQVASGESMNSPWYLYRETNLGVATGFFANSNHMASLLLVSIPFIAALGATMREGAKDLRLRSAALALVCGGLVVVVLGLVLNGSLAGYGLGLPVVLASLLLLFRPRGGLARGGFAAIMLGGLIAVALLWSSPIARGAGTSVSSRQAISAKTFELARDFAPLGAGLGTFEKLYQTRENPNKVDRFYVNHAHDDYLELAVETGLPGIAIVLLFLAWWANVVVGMLRTPAADPYAKAGAIAAAAILLHSLVDYPLRTAALSTVFAMCLVLTVQSRRTGRTETDLRPVRHVVIG
jgi:O-antigen ligase